MACDANAPDDAATRNNEILLTSSNGPHQFTAGRQQKNGSDRMGERILKQIWINAVEFSYHTVLFDR
jgi:hypothetical protein